MISSMTFTLVLHALLAALKQASDQALELFKLEGCYSRHSMRIDIIHSVN